MMFLGFIPLVLKNLMLGCDILTMCFNCFGKHQIITEKIAGFFYGSLTNKKCFDVFGEIGIDSCLIFHFPQILETCGSLILKMLVTSNQQLSAKSNNHSLVVKTSVENL